MINPETLDLSTLPSVALEAKSELPTQSAIYFAIDSQGVIQYIGRSVNTNRRWKNHHRFGQLTSIGNIRIAYLLMDADLLPSVEQALIKWFDPALNRSPIEFDINATTHIRIPKALKEELNRIADSEQRDQIVVLTRLLTSPECLPVAIAKSDEVAA
jgi:hypothetical protein